jgi:DNA repair exonuclease SbcCD ATPase subunit
MEIKKIKVRNFKSFVGTQEFDFQKVNGLIFVNGKNYVDDTIGSNGSGKSSLFSDAILWGFFGKTASGLKSTNVKNWSSNDTSSVVIEFDNHVLERTYKPNALKLDDKIITQEELENLLG